MNKLYIINVYRRVICAVIFFFTCNTIDIEGEAETAHIHGRRARYVPNASEQIQRRDRVH